MAVNVGIGAFDVGIIGVLEPSVGAPADDGHPVERSWLHLGRSSDVAHGAIPVSAPDTACGTRAPVETG